MNKYVKFSIAVILLMFLLVFGYGGYQYKSIEYPQPKTSGNGNITISCVGDSITYGLGVYYNRGLAWATILPEKLGKEYKTINYGIINRTLISTGNYPYLKEEIAQKFLDSKEDIVIFMLGTNDSKICNWNEEQFEKDYNEFIDTLLSRENKPQVYVMIPPKIFLETLDEDEPYYKNLEEGVIPTIKRVIATKESINVIDLYSLTQNHPEWFSDGVHPNKEGNEKIADEIAKVIKSTYINSGVQ